jgi:hypothetical protein
MLTQEQVCALIQENSHIWEKLLKLSHHFTTEEQWRKHFSYIRFDFMSQSNYASLPQIIGLLRIDRKEKTGANIDSSIIMKTFLALRKLTTFALDG